MINVLIYSSTYDVGGQGYRIKQAFDRYQPNFSVRSVHNMEGHFSYPRDLRKGHPDVVELFANANIVHMRNGFSDLKRYRKDLTGVGLVIHHHGTKFREEHARLTTQAVEMGAIQLASTIDLTMLEPDVRWLPSPFEMEELAKMREAIERPPGPIRIAHAPTNRQVKSTLVIMEAIRELNRRGIECTLDLIERQPWATVLERKAKADIYVDQLKLGYGNNAVEAWGMGVPVVAGASDKTVLQGMLDRFDGRLPFLDATEGNLVARLALLIADTKLRRHWGQVGWQHAMRYHDAETVSSQLALIYHEALASSPQPEGVSYAQL